ncbi:hypothetical protein BpHYR1_042491 [Brachionus plicatilis]|uniref:Uncharacterized protein n=1 Tax=Brachionus plicatilis TaxID=10195 RepID=A0A3M7SXP1_BRAPC|nr:hypothetical protein BpHYR1_042491 [Brachionus plicatilis]
MTTIMCATQTNVAFLMRRIEWRYIFSKRYKNLPGIILWENCELNLTTRHIQYLKMLPKNLQEKCDRLKSKL